jgi:plasmid stabilization system protein ParE
VTHVIYSRRALTDLERLADFLREEAPRAAVAAVDTIIDGVQILGRHPLIGRACEAGLRELVISYGKRGHVALYSYEPGEDVALILAVRHQREAGYDLGL